MPAGNDSLLVQKNTAEFVVLDKNQGDNATAYSDWYRNAVKKREINVFTQLAEKAEKEGRLEEAEATRAEVARLKEEVTAFEQKYGETEQEQFSSLNEEYDQLTDDQFRAVSLFTGTGPDEIQSMMEGDPEDLLTNVNPVTRVWKKIEKIAGKVTHKYANIRGKSKSSVAAANRKGVEKQNSGGVPKGGKADFIVSKDGAVVPNSPAAARNSLENAGFGGKKVSNPSGTETGTIHNVPGMKMDVRVMDGGSVHPPRVVTTRQGTRQPVNPSNGSNFGNVPKSEQRARSHIPFSQ